MSYKIRSRWLLISTVALTLILYTVIKYTLPALAEDNGTSSKKVILIDPGHGGYDGGAKGTSKIQEKDINLAIALKLRDKLMEQGFEVKMTRDIDKDLLGSERKFHTKKAEDMFNRYKMKEEFKPDLFISIHQNHFSEGQYYGPQVWYSKFKGSDTLARITQGTLKSDLGIDNNRVEKSAGSSFKILKENDNMPSILVECGFLSNYEEEQRLLDKNYQSKIADSLAKSIKKYFEQN